jgi:hypothetical protein
MEKMRCIWFREKGKGKREKGKGKRDKRTLVDTITYNTQLTTYNQNV